MPKMQNIFLSKSAFSKEYLEITGTPWVSVIALALSAEMQKCTPQNLLILHTSIANSVHMVAPLAVILIEILKMVKITN